jgi:carboxylesterase
LSDAYPVLPGAEAWSAAGHGARAEVGLLLVHGFTGNPVALRPLAEMLARRGFSIELVRLPGHGTHVRDLDRTSYDDWLAEVERALSELEKRTPHTVLLGFSMGGTLVLDLASRQSSRVAGVVTINALILDRAGILPRFAPVLEKILPFAPASFAGLAKNDIRKPAADERAYAWVSSKAGNSLLRELSRVRERLPRLLCPALVIHSEEDHSVPPQNSQEVLARIGSADKTSLVLERSYHVAPLDYDQELIEERVTAFADRVSGLASAG